MVLKQIVKNALSLYAFYIHTQRIYLKIIIY